MITKTKAGTFQVRIYSGTVQIGTRTFTLKKDAEIWERDQKQALQRGEWHDERLGKIKLGEVITKFTDTRRGLISEHAWQTDEANLRLHIPAEMKRRTIGSIRAEDLTALLNSLLKIRARRTVARIRDSMVALWAYAEGQRYVPRNTAAKSKIAKGTGQVDEPVRPLTAEQLEEVVRGATLRSAEYGRMIEFISLTGLRWGEARELRVGDVVQAPIPLIRVRRSRSDGFEVGSTKSRKPRRVPLVDRAEELALGQSVGKKADDLLFTAPRGGQVSGPNLTRALRWGDLSSHRIHDLRHTAATRWIAAGVSITIVSAWLGHADPAITLRIYAGYLEENSLASLDLLRAAALMIARPKPSPGNLPADRTFASAETMKAEDENAL